MIVRMMSFLGLAVCLFALALSPPLAGAQDYDGDGTLDPADPCPHIAGISPTLMASPWVKLDYRGTGPGSGDDVIILRRLGAFFITHVPYDPDSVDNVHVTLRKTTNPGPDLWSTTLAAGPPWVQHNLGGKGHQQWDYNGPAPGVAIFKGLIRNALVAPFGSGLNRLTIKKAIDASITNGPLGLGDSIVSILEVENTIVPFTGVCFEATSATCSLSPAGDECFP